MAEEQHQRLDGMAVSVPNPWYENLNMVLAQIETETAGLRARKAAYEKHLNALHDQQEYIMEIENKLKRMEQEFDREKGKHDALAGRLESARLAGSAEKTEDDTIFRVINPPRTLGTRGEILRKQLMMSVEVLIAALGGGVAVSLLLGQLLPVVYGGVLVKEIQGLPVYAVICRDLTWKERVQRYLDVSALVLSVILLFSVHFILTYNAMIAPKEVTAEANTVSPGNASRED
jgi:hypothetical protein